MGERRAPDVGFYIPYRIPKLSAEELRAMRRMGSFERVLLVARRFLRLPDMDPISLRLDLLGNGIAVCEMFQRENGSFRGYIRSLARQMGLCSDTEPGWLEIGIRIGVIASATVDLASTKGSVDLSMVSGDLFGPLSAYLAREMGFPVGDILCCCNTNSGFWELLHHGQFRTDQISARTGIPEADIAVPDGLECLIALCCGREEAVRYVEALRSGKPYVPGGEGSDRLRSAFRSTVVTGSGILRGGYITRGSPVKAGTALALAGLLDHRARTCSCSPALVIAE